MITAAGGAVFLLAVVGPAGALIVRSVVAGQAPSEGWLPSARQWGLLADTVVLAMSGVCVSTMLALPAAYVVGQFGRPSDRPWMVAILVAPLLLPPMVYAFGWQRIVALPGPVQCVWVWSAWSWPVPAMILGSGWSRFGRAAYEAALLSTSAGSAFPRVVLPLLSRHAAASGLILMVLFMGEYSVPHACGLSVYATELLGLAESHGARTIEVLWPSLPLVAVLGATVLAAWRLWRRSDIEHDAASVGSGSPVVSKGMMTLAMGLVALTVVLPIARLACQPAIFSWMADAWRVYRGELMESLGVSLAAGVMAVAMGVGLAMGSAGRNVATALALAFGILPGALVGEALVAAYLRVGILYDYWPIVVLSYVARFGWVGTLAGLLAMRSVHRDLVQQARTDGADELNVDARIRLWPNWPVLAGGVCIVAAFSLADVTAVSLVRVPSIGTISLTLIEKMHRFEEGMLVSLSLWLVAAALPAAALAALALRRRA